MSLNVEKNTDIEEKQSKQIEESCYKTMEMATDLINNIAVL